MPLRRSSYLDAAIAGRAAQVLEAYDRKLAGIYRKKVANDVRLVAGWCGVLRSQASAWYNRFEEDPMPRKDHIHGTVKNVLIKDGWRITDDPFRIVYEDMDKLTHYRFLIKRALTERAHLFERHKSCLFRARANPSCSNRTFNKRALSFA